MAGGNKSNSPKAKKRKIQDDVRDKKRQAEKKRPVRGTSS